MGEDDLLKAELVLLRQEHAALEREIREEEARPSPDRLQIQRLKKRKLAVKDRIARIEDVLYPDIIA
ncbi:MAG: YdcH family protein [Paracoccaceae bacterium]